MADKYERALNLICTMDFTELKELLDFGDRAPCNYGIDASTLADKILYRGATRKIRALMQEIGADDFFKIVKEIYENEYN